jgi:hypothetical protein
MGKIDMEFGMDVLTGSYNKLKLFMAAVKNSSELGAWGSGDNDRGP